MLSREENAYLCEVEPGKPMHAVNRANNYQQDRDAMRRQASFSGLSDVVIEDIAVTETMGEISDRTIEHLVASDAAVVRARSALIRNARRLAEGQQPAGVSLDRAPLGAQGFVTKEQPWQSWFSEWKSGVRDVG